jgi:beta-glucosidase
MAINKPILRNLLRNELGFEGIVISDYGSIEECVTHGAAEDMADAAIKAMEASMDIEMATTAYQENIPKLVESGRLDIKLVDEAVGRVLRWKYESGLFDDPYKYFRPEDVAKSYSKENLDVSLRLARESAVLLKNNGVLPLAKGTKLALIGPKADSTDLLGPWQFTPRLEETVTLKQGLTALGCEIASCVKGSEVEAPIEGGITEALRAAEAADVIILALGETSAMSGEAASRQNITIPDAQLELTKAVKETGKPIVLVLTNGRPLLLGWFDEHADAILETWFLGSQAGTAIAEILTGTYNPTGKLSITFPRHPGQIPLYYNHLNTGRPYKDGDTSTFLSRYLDGPNTPLYPFGHGLSYTSFKLENMTLSSGTLKDGSLTARVTITHTGKLAGADTVQLYLRDVAASIARPVKELKGFKRVELNPGESAVVSFEISEPMLRFYNAQGKEVSEPGRFEVMLGTGSGEECLLRSEFVLE